MKSLRKDPDGFCHGKRFPMVAIPIINDECLYAAHDHRFLAENGRMTAKLGDGA
jgi:hypothetical protein